MESLKKTAKRLSIISIAAFVVIFLAISAYGNSSTEKELKSAKKIPENKQENGAFSVKAGFHIHTGDDVIDNLSYSTYDLIDTAKKMNFDAIALTFHENVLEHEKYERYAEYAADKNILLIRGIEADIEGKDVVILNCPENAEDIKNFEELREYKKQNPQIFVFAPHPFVPDSKSLFQLLEKNIDIFDAIELSIFSNETFNFNEKAEKIAEKYNKQLIATADVHFQGMLNRGYVILNVEEKTPEKIFQRIKSGKIENRLDPLTPEEMFAHKIKFSYIWRAVSSAVLEK
ncbi:MAG: PHP domain-containing protein [Candidatus Pacebacteria bacterium]|nr:PHP domain-containing protein [Candidatus Paceibacterota bacterium]